MIQDLPPAVEFEAANPVLGAAGDFDRLAAEFEAGLNSITAAVVEQFHARVDFSTDQTGLACSDLTRLTRRGLAAQMRSFRLYALPEDCPEFALDAVRVVAPARKLDLLLSGYRLAHMELWQTWFDLVETSPLAHARRSDLLQRGSSFFFRYADLLSNFVAEEYQRQVDQRLGSPDQRRFHAIRALLAGESPHPDSLDFNLDRYHLGLIAWGPDPVAVARQLAGTLERPLLSISLLERDHSHWAWISGARPLDAIERRRLTDFQPQDGSAALGLEAFGEAGFRASHRQALRARKFAPSGCPALTRYDDVVLEALSTENEAEALAFVAHELRGIGDDSTTSRRLRETLVAYFSSECNAASAGATLGVHQQTVANRLRKAEERMGQISIRARRVELEVALRLRAALVHKDP